MSSTPEPLPESTPSSDPRAMPWPLIAAAAALLLLNYAPVLHLLVRDWIIDENVGHGFFVPLVALYVVWQRRGKLLEMKLRPNWLGLAFLLWGALQLYAATLGAEMFLARTALLISLVGILVLLGGFALVRALAFPLLLLPLMIPIPAIIYSQVTLPLQLFASQMAEQSLAVLGIPVLREGNILELPSQQLNVVEACSGIRSLLSLSFLALVYAYFFDGRLWMRPVLFVATVPIAILSNAARVTITGIISEFDKELASGVFHLAEGWVVFLVALALLVVTHQVIGRLASLIRPPAAAHPPRTAR